MTFQWAAVATFLYAEIGLILIFCLPFIPPQRWQKIFSFNIWGKIATFWNKAFLTIIVLLIVLFLDAVREVRKYSSVTTVEKSLPSRPGAHEHTQMKLFRSQRNLYISGFSLFFWLVLRRLVTLITQLAKELSNKGVLKTQAEDTNEAAKKFMKENEKLRQLLKGYSKEEEHLLQAQNKKLVEDQEKLKTELKKTSDGNFMCMCQSRKSMVFYAVALHCFPLNKSNGLMSFWLKYHQRPIYNFSSCSNTKIKHCFSQEKHAVLYRKTCRCFRSVL